MMSEYEYVVITVSDSCYHGTAVDKSGPALEELLKRHFNAEKILRGVVPDDQAKIEEVLLIFSDEQRSNVIFTTGGTGFAVRDVTPEATRAVIIKEAPQLSYLMIANQMSNLGVDKRNKMVALSRAVCGIRKQTLIINFPGSVKAVTESFESIKDVLPHAVQLLVDDVQQVKSMHNFIQNHDHVCPHQTKEHPGERHSEYQMIDVDRAQDIIFENTPTFSQPVAFSSGVNIPPFRASIKDGYAVGANSGKGIKKVIGFINAGDPINETVFKDDECFKINTGAAIPLCAGAIIQVEDTKLITEIEGVEAEIEIRVEPKYGLDIREVGSDLKTGTFLFNHRRPLTTIETAILASVGQKPPHQWKPKIAVFSTGDELLSPGTELFDGKIYDCNSAMLEGLLNDFGFEVTYNRIVKDEENDLENSIEKAHELGCHVIISSGGVSMGDKDYVKPVLAKKGYNIKFGRVNMKPGKPMTFGFNSDKKVQYFGLPGNPVSAFVTFHLFVLPGLRKMCSDDDALSEAKLRLPIVTVQLLNENYSLDSRPEYARATVISKDGVLYAEITGNQISSRLRSVQNADVLLHLPPRTVDKLCVTKGQMLKASILKLDFISRYE